MVFSSLTFLFFFLPLTLLLYYAANNIRYRNYILLVMSLLFYAWGEPVYVILMILSLVLNFNIGQELAKNKTKSMLVFGVLINVFVIGYFKYYGFFLEIIGKISGLNLHAHKLPLPIGISFYTFQALSYLIDIYRGKCEPQKKASYFALYITMFPQLIAGPIVRYQDIEKQLGNRSFEKKQFEEGIRIFIIGLFKKLVFANTLGAVHDEIMSLGTENLSALSAWTCAICYALQIFNDFSGYSDMAIGLGKMFGFEFNKNFDRPYSSLSVTEFWRRWHISLSAWFKEYVYIPLGGNRKGWARQIVNLLIVWTLTGLWHGAALNFVAWGLYYGILLILEKFVFGRFLEKLPVVFRWLFTALMVLIGWVFFFSPSLKSSLSYLSAMAAKNGAADHIGKFYAGNSLILIVLAMLPACVNIDTGDEKTGNARIVTAFRWLTYAMLFALSLCFLVGESYNPFLYFRF